MIDHILERLDLADAYAANAARIAAQMCRPQNSRDLIRRCREAAERHRSEAADLTRKFAIDPQVVRQERAAWRQLRRYPLDRADGLTIADVRWLKAVLRHGRLCSRNVRRAAELLLLTDELRSDRLADWPVPKAEAVLAGVDGEADKASEDHKRKFKGPKERKPVHEVAISPKASDM